MVKSYSQKYQIPVNFDQHCIGNMDMKPPGFAPGPLVATSRFDYLKFGIVARDSSSEIRVDYSLGQGASQLNGKLTMKWICAFLLLAGD